MRVLIIGGKNSKNIVEGVNKKLGSAGVIFSVTNSLSDITNFYIRGEYFDRVLIVEQGITNDGELDRDACMKLALGEFNNTELEYGSKSEYVFVVKEEKTAATVYEECIDILKNGVILCVKPPYQVNFFVSVVKDDIKSFKKEYYFDYELSLPERKRVKEIEQGFSDFEDFGETSEDYGDAIEVDDIDTMDFEVEEEKPVEEVQVEQTKPIPKVVATEQIKKIGLGIKIPVFKKREEKTKEEKDAVGDAGNFYNEDELDFKLYDNNIKMAVKTAAQRGCSIVFTGCGGCGTSTIAYNTANALNKIGYRVLLVDMDAQGRSQSYISKASYDSVDIQAVNLVSALNSSKGVHAYTSILKNGFHLLSMGLATDVVKLDRIIKPLEAARFINSVKLSTDFIIYDIPFNDAVESCGDITLSADHIVMVIDGSTWGVVKASLALGNINTKHVRDTIFNIGQIIVNKFDRDSKILGSNCRGAKDVVDQADKFMDNILGGTPEYLLSGMSICGEIRKSNYKDLWFEKTQYTDKKEGIAEYTKIINNIIVRKDIKYR